MSQDKSWPRFPDEAEDRRRQLIVQPMEPVEADKKPRTDLTLPPKTQPAQKAVDVVVKREFEHQFDFRKTWRDALDFLVEHWWKFLILLIAILFALWKNSPPEIPSITEPNPEVEKVANERFDAIVRDRRNRGCTNVYPGTSEYASKNKDAGCRPKGQPP